MFVSQNIAISPSFRNSTNFSPSHSKDLFSFHASHLKNLLFFPRWLFLNGLDAQLVFASPVLLNMQLKQGMIATLPYIPKNDKYLFFRGHLRAYQHIPLLKGSSIREPQPQFLHVFYQAFYGLFRKYSPPRIPVHLNDKVILAVNYFSLNGSLAAFGEFLMLYFMFFILLFLFLFLWFRP